MDIPKILKKDLPNIKMAFLQRLNHIDRLYLFFTKHLSLKEMQNGEKGILKQLKAKERWD